MLGNGIAEGHGGARTAAGDELAVFGDNLARVLSAFQLALHTGVACCLHSLQYAHVSVHHGGGTDGGQGLALGMVLQYGLAQGLALVQIGAAGQTAGQHEHVRSTQVHVGQKGICHHAHAMCTIDDLLAGNAYRGYVQTCTSDDVQRSQCLDVFKSGC